MSKRKTIDAFFKRKDVSTSEIRTPEIGRASCRERVSGVVGRESVTESRYLVYVVCLYF